MYETEAFNDRRLLLELSASPSVWLALVLWFSCIQARRAVTVWGSPRYWYWVSIPISVNESVPAPESLIGNTFEARPNVPTSHEWSPKFGSTARRQYGATPLIGLCPVVSTPRASCVLVDNGR